MTSEAVLSRRREIEEGDKVDGRHAAGIPLVPPMVRSAARRVNAGLSPRA